MKRYLVLGLFLIVLCMGVFLILTSSVPGSDLSSVDILGGLLAVGGCGAVFVLVIAWILGGCSLG